MAVSINKKMLDVVFSGSTQEECPFEKDGGEYYVKFDNVIVERALDGTINLVHKWKGFVIFTQSVERGFIYEINAVPARVQLNLEDQ